MGRRGRQLALDLGRHSRDRHRGGRPRGPRPAVPHRVRKEFPAVHPCLVTWKVRDEVGRALRRRDVVREIENALRAGKEKLRFRLVEYSIQHGHAHLIVEADGRLALGRGMQALAIRFARAVNRVLGRKGAVFAERYHLRVLSSPRQVRNARAYVLDNSRHHEHQRRERLRARGVAVAPLPNAGTIDGASSARWFTGWCREVDRSPPFRLGLVPAVAEARTWLLRIGWRKHGLLDPNEIPG